ncbi:hypothetical protein VTL71DRAFT_9973 [Oculimacula yallundae]|uniref:Enoyl reductase (ER) domain-containing protein n=1 Tax=Oculimacula yallundae TaxID=86028 RepID=A0ABR4BST0_9HELO
MPESTYLSIVLAQRPDGDIVPGKTLNFKENPILDESNLKDGEILAETLYLSLDPGLRNSMNDIDRETYMSPVQLGDIMRGWGISKVIASKSSSHPVGSYVFSLSGWTEMAIIAAKDAEIISIPPNTRVTDGLGLFGITGLTAYFGLIDVGKIKKGDFVVVSGAAGATGSVACQIAKLKGAKVLGLAGSKEKVAWLKELGCDEALNYKDIDFKAKFNNATTELIDVYFDNVGGEILEAAISRAKDHARFVICGAISQYNSPNPAGPRNFVTVIVKRIKMEGFIVLDYEKQFPEARKEIAQWLAEGKLERKDTIIKGGLKAAEEAFLGLFKGSNTGKLLVEVKSDSDREDMGSSL